MGGAQPLHPPPRSATALCNRIHTKRTRDGSNVFKTEYFWCVTGLFIPLLFHRYVTTSLSVSVTAVGEEQTAVYGRSATHKVSAGQPRLICSLLVIATP